MEDEYKRYTKEMEMKHFKVQFEPGIKEEFGGNMDRFVLRAPEDVNVYMETDQMVDFVNCLLEWKEGLAGGDEDDKNLVLMFKKKLARDYRWERYLVGTKINEKCKLELYEFDFHKGRKQKPTHCSKMEIDPLNDDVYKLCKFVIQTLGDSKQSNVRLEVV
jgi:hypothetical protein